MTSKNDPSFPAPIRDYSFLGDGERGALVGPQGDIQWMCFPQWDSPSVFASMMRGNGSFSVKPSEPFVWSGFYEEGSLIWRSRWAADGGLAESRDALAFPGNNEHAVILRQLRGRKSTSSLRVNVHPVPAYGNKGITNWKHKNGIWTASQDGVFVRLSGAVGARVHKDDSGDCLVFDVTLGPNETCDLMLEFSTKEYDKEPRPYEEAWAATEAAWQQTVPRMENLAPSRDARHAYAVLTGLTASSGAMVAAATMGLPESVSRGRGYDYRYAWIRDQSISGQALSLLGPDPLFQKQTRFVVERVLADGAKLKPAYRIDGNDIPAPHPVGFPGYPGGNDIAGNQVLDHFQLDMSGDTLLLLAAAARNDTLEVEGWQAVQIIADAIKERHNEKDNGIWELEERRWTHSRLMCAAGLRAVAAVPNASGEAAKWLALADSLVAEVGATSVHHTGRWQRADDDPRVDASLLVPGLRGATAFDDPRNLATIEAVLNELVEDGYVYRYKHSDSELGQPEGAFLLCGFWLGLAKHRLKDTPRALQLFERNRAACGPSAILAEEFDVLERQLRGNLPQAFVHAVLLESAVVSSTAL